MSKRLPHPSDEVTRAKMQDVVRSPVVHQPRLTVSPRPKDGSIFSSTAKM